MSDVTNSKKIVKLACDMAKAGFDIAADGKLSISDLLIAYPVAQELLGDLGAFSGAVAELRALDVAGADALVAEVVADLSIPSARVQAIVKAILHLEPAVVDLINAWKMPA